MSETARPILLCAGGTGGHLFPAEALAGELGRRGVPVELVTDSRAAAYAGSFPARAVHAVSSATFGSRAPMAVFRTASALGTGVGESLRLIGSVRPAAVVGFGGYPSIPPVLAAQLRGVPTIVHEQNGVMGRANRLLAYRATAIATGFPRLAKAAPKITAKAVHVGNPVRPAVVVAAEVPYDAPTRDGRFELLVFGGSQGASIMAQVVPPAIAMLDAPLRERLHVVQQARGEDLAAVSDLYAASGVAADCAPFFNDLPQRMANAHLVIGRSGASSVAELAIIGRPSILVPLPHSLDQDQLTNANALAEIGAAEVVLQSQFTPEGLAARLTALLLAPEALSAQAEAARAMAAPDAAARLADLVLQTAARAA
jgi:UDP-N-acetylglucosamine--N-acetylmuramyl-(pentapeptide) pyrophosphoryl-undecaprenol N-acetylglucosamine transferase